MIKKEEKKKVPFIISSLKKKKIVFFDDTEHVLDSRLIIVHTRAISLLWSTESNGLILNLITFFKGQ